MIDQMKNWNYYYDLVKLSDHLSIVLKDNAIKSLNILRKSLGEEWLSSKDVEKHPIFWDLRGIESMSNLTNILSLGEGISSLEKIKGFDRLFWKLKNNKDFYSTFAELELASKLKKKASIELEPEINGKKPDILCKYKGKDLFIEKKSLGRARDSLKADITVSTLSSHNEIPIHPCGKVMKIMEGDELENVKNIVKNTCQSAIKSKTSKECFIPNKVKFYFVPNEVSNRIELYQNWCDKQEFFDSSSKGHKGGLMYPDDQVLQEKRVRTRLLRIKDENQLPYNKPCLVILDSNQFYFWMESQIQNHIDYLQSILQEMPNIVAIGLDSKLLGDEIKKKEITKIQNENYLITSYPYNLIRRDLLIIGNPYSKQDFNIKSVVELLA